MTREAVSPDLVAELLLHVGRAGRSDHRRSDNGRPDDGRSDLTAAQWTCLRFFARANGSTRTPSAFASFQATTRGTASQIVKSLEGRGLVTRHRSPRDGRSVSFDLTEAGRAALANDPLRDLIGVIGQLEDADRDRLRETLSRVAATLSDRRGTPAFGTCRDCRHFAPGAGTGYCACMAADLAAEELDKLCASYRGPAQGTENEGDPNGRI
jgi:DNA-binding MarR family transcriptional regulator